MKRDSIQLIHECILKILVDSKEVGSVSCTPEDLEELAAGWLLTEGVISRREEIAEIVWDQPMQQIIVRTTGETIEQTAERTTEWEVSARNFSAGDSEKTMATGLSKTMDTGPANETVSWTASDLQQIYAAFAVDPPLHAATRAAHSCMIVRHAGEAGTPEDKSTSPEDCSDRVEVLYRSEDAGRHSALDKAIGWALLKGVDLSLCFLMTSGRISTRMAAKAGRAGAAALAGKGTVTAEAVELAEQYGMTLIGYFTETDAIWFCGDGR